MEQDTPSADDTSLQNTPDPKFFYPNLTSIPAGMTELLSSYSNIPTSDHISHVLSHRNKAYASHPYPCLGRFRFLELDLSSYPLYEAYVLPTMKQSQTSSSSPPIFLDLGTCLGQDLRKLLYDGVAVSQVYGSDIVPEFIDLGYDLFRDRDRIPRDRFIVPGNVFDDAPDNTLSVLDGKVDILHVTAVFHLFDLEKQKILANRCLRLMRKDRNRRVLMLGGQAGNINPMSAERSERRSRFRHNEDSWREMWQEVCDEEEWKGRIKQLDAGAVLEERFRDPKDGCGTKVIGSAEEGFRWMVWHVWITFES